MLRTVVAARARLHRRRWRLALGRPAHPPLAARPAQLPRATRPARPLHGNESDMNASEDEGMFYDSEFNLSDDDLLFDDYVDPDVEFGESNKGKLVEGNEWCGDDVYAIAPAENIEEEGCVHSDGDFASTYDSDDEENVKYQMYNPMIENKNASNEHFNTQQLTYSSICLK
ncbi:hypothetical protein Salat_1703500 [Sesamum alatum]|uniref:Uncharacterized protein n=1 Tax=Sesamum alatum TaxID=300844 RepID=A0AAE1Y827_9LAMI|nr:hypothetical protein Salat_1703500 [Sesamum alatum]